MAVESSWHYAGWLDGIVVERGFFTDDGTFKKVVVLM